VDVLQCQSGKFGVNWFYVTALVSSIKTDFPQASLRHNVCTENRTLACSDLWPCSDVTQTTFYVGCPVLSCLPGSVQWNSLVWPDYTPQTTPGSPSWLTTIIEVALDRRIDRMKYKHRLYWNVLQSSFSSKYVTINVLAYSREIYDCTVVPYGCTIKSVQKSAYLANLHRYCSSYTYLQVAVLVTWEPCVLDRIQCSAPSAVCYVLTQFWDGNVKEYSLPVYIKVKR